MEKQAFKCLGKEKGSLTLAEREWNFNIRRKRPPWKCPERCLLRAAAFIPQIKVIDCFTLMLS